MSAEIEKLYEAFKKKHNIRNDYLHGTSWSRGGNHRNCWGGNYEITPDPIPSFHYRSCYAFEELINSIFINITDREKDDLFRLTFNVEDYQYSDYYGGTAYYSRFVYDIRRLFEILYEKGYIDKEYYLR